MLETLLSNPLLLAVAQLVLLPLLTVIAALSMRRAPAHAHATIIAGLIATLIAPLLTLLVSAVGGGLFPALTLDMAPRASTTIDDSIVAATAPSVPWLMILTLMTWTAITAVLVVRLVIGFRRGLQVARRARPIAGGDALLQRARPQRAGVPPVTVCCSTELDAPAMACWSRPARLLLPPCLVGDTEAASLIPFLRHELAHLDRRDHWWRLLAECATSLLPWHPAIWWLRGRVYETSESACDARAILTGTPRARYADALVDLATCRTSRAPALSGLKASERLARRIEVILRPDLTHDRTSRGVLLALALVTATVTTTTALAQRRPIEIATSTATDMPIQALPGELDLGIVAPGATAEGVLRLANAGTTSVRLLGGKPACGCTTIDLHPHVLEPGAVITVPVTLNAPAEHATDRVRTISFLFEGLDPLVVTVRLRTDDP